MAKRIIVIAVLIVVALVGYSFVTTGKFALIPAAASPEEREIEDLIGQVRQASTQFAQAGRAAGMSGVDTTADAESARQQLAAVQRKAKDLQKKPMAKTRDALARLEQELDRAKQDMGIR